jgi:hypothetical protein
LKLRHLSAVALLALGSASLFGGGCQSIIGIEDREYDASLGSAGEGVGGDQSGGKGNPSGGMDANGGTMNAEGGSFSDAGSGRQRRSPRAQPLRRVLPARRVELQERLPRRHAGVLARLARVFVEDDLHERVLEDGSG